jgi:NAD+ kinase
MPRKAALKKSAPDDSFVSKPVTDIRSLGVVALKGNTGPVMEVVRAFAAAHPHVKVSLNSHLRPYAGKGLTVRSDAYLATKVDALLSLGGDGTFLAAARLAHAKEVPVLGVNLGRVGFLADVSPADLSVILEHLLHREYTLRHRMLLQVEHWRGRKLLRRDIALNEVAFAGVMGTQMIELEVKANGNFLTGYRVDGLLVSTPTGSTAYALSAGGPIVHPAASAILLTPMNPASLSVRPLVLPDSMKIEVCNVMSRARALNLFSDGRQRGDVLPGDVVRLSKHPQRLRIVRPQGSSYFDSLRNKLGWTGNWEARTK